MSSAVLLQGFVIEVVRQSGVWSNHAAATGPRWLQKALAVVAEAARANLTSYQGACQVFFAALLWSLGSQLLLKFSFSSS
jgi:hypothetical protein